jgi:hypothetical protein
VKLVGLGGVGGIVARYLAVFLRSLEQQVDLWLIDGDRFEPSNGQRMLFSALASKAAVLAHDLGQALGAEALVQLHAIEAFLDPGNIAELLHDHDLVLLCVDNHFTRKIVSDYCAQILDDVVLISGGNDGVGADSTGRTLRGTYGNVQAFVRRGGRDLTPALDRFHPEIRRPLDAMPHDRAAGCAAQQQSAPQLLFTNLTTAAAMLNTFWLAVGGAGGGLSYGELCFDIAEGLMRPLPLAAPG